MDQLAIPTRPFHAAVFAVQTYIRHTAREYRKKRKIFAFFVLFVLYTAGALFSHTAYDFISPALLWPSAGIALALLFLEGVDLWPAIFISSFLISTLQGAHFPVAFGLAVANSIENVVGAVILRRTNFTPLLASLRDIIILIVVALCISAIGPTLGALALYVNGLPLSGLQHIWGPWWLGRVLSHLVLGTMLMRWLVRWPFKRSMGELITWTLSFTFLIGASYIVFWTRYTEIGNVPLVYIILVPLIWMALSIGPRGVTLALFVMTAISISGVLLGYVGPGELPISDQLINIEVFDGIITIIFLIFVSSEEGRKLASRALKEHITQLESALHRISSEDRAKNEFLAILAHELRNPLAPILSSLELMRLPNNSAHEVERLLDTMDDRVHTMARLLDDLLDISRISQKKFKLQKETVDLNHVLERSAETAAVLMQSKNHTLEVTLLDKPTWISGDPVRLEQIVINLLNNAAKYTDPGGTISLRAKLNEGSISIRIKDSGVGIPREMLGRIFEPFLQVEQARRSEGLGIGLSLAKRLIEMHQGSIEARSEGLGRGSEFIVHLPVPSVVQLPMPVTPRGKRSHAIPKYALNIFVVDDNKLAAEGLGKLLTYKGHTVTLAYDAEQALAIAPQLNPDAVVLDIGLPDRDGYYVARQLKERGLRSFFIALTGYGQDEDKLKAQQAGFDYHLTKPVSISDIEIALSTVSKLT